MSRNAVTMLAFAILFAPEAAYGWFRVWEWAGALLLHS